MDGSGKVPSVTPGRHSPKSSSDNFKIPGELGVDIACDEREIENIYRNGGVLDLIPHAKKVSGAEGYQHSSQGEKERSQAYKELYGERLVEVCRPVAGTEETEEHHD